MPQGACLCEHVCLALCVCLSGTVRRGRGEVGVTAQKPVPFPGLGALRAAPHQTWVEPSCPGGRPALSRNPTSSLLAPPTPQPPWPPPPRPPGPDLPGGGGASGTGPSPLPESPVLSPQPVWGPLAHAGTHWVGYSKVPQQGPSCPCLHAGFAAPPTLTDPAQQRTRPELDPNHPGPCPAPSRGLKSLGPPGSSPPSPGLLARLRVPAGPRPSRSLLPASRTIGDRMGEAKASGNLGNTLKVLGRFDEAVVCCQRHLDIAQEQGDKVGRRP